MKKIFPITDSKRNRYLCIYNSIYSFSACFPYYEFVRSWFFIIKSNSLKGHWLFETQVCQEFQQFQKLSPIPASSKELLKDFLFSLCSPHLQHSLLPLLLLIPLIFFSLTLNKLSLRSDWQFPQITGISFILGK